jgi:hypothetical protein
MSDEPRAYFFGCWGEPGHFMHTPGGRRLYDARWCYLPLPGNNRAHVDGSLAPKRYRDSAGISCFWLEAQTNKRTQHYSGEECNQGEFLRHVIDFSDGRFTVISWWDRQQGDTRGACNSNFFLEGEHTSEEMLAALQHHFPHILENLKKGGIELVAVYCG